MTGEATRCLSQRWFGRLGTSIAGSLIVAGPMVGYLHLADSNRWAPGRGHIDFGAILGALHAIGYHDWVAAEVLPYQTAEQAAQEAITYLRRLP